MDYSLYRVKKMKVTKLNDMSTRELVDYIISGQKYANERRETVLNAVEKGQISLPPAYRNFKPSKQSPETISYRTMIFGGTEDINELKKMSRGELLHNAVRIRSFLNAKTSTLYGWRQYAKTVAENLKEIAKTFHVGYKDITPSSLWGHKADKFWEIYEKWGERVGYNFGEGGSDRAQLMLFRAVFINKTTRNLTADEIVEKMVKKFETNYERAELKRKNGKGSNSKFDKIE